MHAANSDERTARMVPISEPTRAVRARRMLTIQKLMSALEDSGRQSWPVVFDCGGFPRGLVAFDVLGGDLMFRSSPAQNLARNVHGELSRALGVPFTRTDGTSFVAGPDTPLWMAGSRFTVGQALVGVRIHGFRIVLDTAPFTEEMVA
ncbi:MAG: hypothetical protein ACMVO3_22885 [Thalassobaculum sp.]